MDNINKGRSGPALRRPSKLRTVEPEQAMRRTAPTTRTATVAIAAVIALVAASCGTDIETAPTSAPEQDETEVPAPATTAAPVTTVAPPPTTKAPPPDEPAPVTTEPKVEPPQITIWSAPRLNGSTLSAEWQVIPDDATCSYDLTDANGNLIGTGVADTTSVDKRGRGIRADYDPVSADAFGSVAIVCTHQGMTSETVELEIHRATYENRSVNSVLPATDEYYFDHDEIRALFPECPPGGRLPPRATVTFPDEVAEKVEDVDGDGWLSDNDWLEMGLDFWESVYESWDTEVHDINGFEVASGWWTTEQLRMYFPSGNVTPQIARQEARYIGHADLLWPGGEDQVNTDWATAPFIYTFDGRDYYSHRSLYRRLENAVGYVSVHPALAPWDVKAKWIRDDGLPGHVSNLSMVRPEELLWDWVDSRYSFVPVDREPTAWAMRTLLEARESRCIAGSMREHCESGDFHISPHMRHPSQGGNRLGSVLWSAICPDIDPDKET